MINYETSEDLNVADEYKKNSVDKNREIARNKRHDTSICVLNVTGGLNISSIFRCAHNLGFKENIVFGKTAFDRRGLVGSQNYSDITKIEGLGENGAINVELFNKTMEERQLFPIFVETGGTFLNEVHWGNMFDRYLRGDGLKPCLVFGNESSGIPQEILDTVDNYALSFVVTIPMLGVMRSFNVSNAAAIVMWDWVAKRKLI